MLRIASVLTSAVLVASSSASANCDSGSSTCSSCVVTGVVNSCVNYSFTADPVCTTLTGTATCVALSPCPKTPCTTAPCNTACSSCVRSKIGASVCLPATLATGLYLNSQNALDSGLDFSTLTSFDIQTVTPQSSGTVAGNAIVTLNGSPIQSLVVGSGSATGAIFEVNSSVEVKSWNNNAGSARVDNNCGTVIVGNLSVGGSSFSVFQSCPQAVVTLPQIDFSARSSFDAQSTLQISGGVAHIGAYGTTSGSITGSGYLKLSGGVSVDGTIPSSVVINVAASGRSAPLAVIDASSSLKTSGNVEGDGTVVVNGNFEVSVTAKVDPKVIVNAAGTFLIDSAVEFKAKTVEVSERAVLVIGANANRGTVTIENFAKCAGTVRIKLATTASAFVSGDRAGAGVALKYSSKPPDVQNCAVEVVDSAGVSTKLTTSTSATAGRRLLASSGTATWGPNSMTYAMGQQSAAATLPFALLPIVMIGFLGATM